MFIGHLAVGLASKKIAPSASLASLLFAALLADVMWPILVALGAEHVRLVPGAQPYALLADASYPWSHSLLMLIVLGAIFFGIHRYLSGENRVGLILGALVVSHWVLDFVSHGPDLPLWPAGPRVGLGLWRSLSGLMMLELAMFATGALIYFRSTLSRDRLGNWGFWVFVALLVGSYIGGVVAPSVPRSVRTFAFGAFAGNLVILLWAIWMGQHRYPAEGPDGVPAPRRVRVDLR